MFTNFILTSVWRHENSRRTYAFQHEKGKPKSNIGIAGKDSIFKQGLLIKTCYNKIG